MNCPKCGAENAPTAQYCDQCGIALADHTKSRSENRFKILVAVFIAVVSIAGAVLAWRISVAASSAADADVSGIVSTISRNEARVASESDMYRNLATYLQVRIHDLLSNSLLQEYEWYPGGDPTRDRLWDEAWTEIFVAEAYLDQVDVRPEYIRPDGSYNGRAAQDIDMAHRALDADFDPQGKHFANADRLRGKVQWLMGLAFILSFSLLFYTLAEVITHKLKYLFFGLGSTIFALVIVALPLIEIRFN